MIFNIIYRVKINIIYYLIPVRRKMNLLVESCVPTGTCTQSALIMIKNAAGEIS